MWNLSAVVRVQQWGKAPEKELLLDPACTSNMATPCVQTTKTWPKKPRMGPAGDAQVTTASWQEHPTWLPIPTCQGSPAKDNLTHLTAAVQALRFIFFWTTQPGSEAQRQQHTTVVVYTWYLPSASSVLAQVRNFMNWLLSESIHNRWWHARVHWLLALPAPCARQLLSALPWAVGSAGCLCFIPRD